MTRADIRYISIKETNWETYDGKKLECNRVISSII